MILKSIYFGGGTPSLWPAQQIYRILDKVGETFYKAKDLEITVEVNPSSSTQEKFRDLFSMGINRLSIGVQVLDDTLLQWLGRPHNMADAIHTLRRAEQARFANVSCDLLFGFPGQHVEHHLKQVGQLITLAPTHISTYSLTLSPSTALGKNGYKPQETDAVAEMMEQGRELLARAGYHQYEVSNYAQQGFSSRHNQMLWSSYPYLGVGAYAHSMMNKGGETIRIANPDLETYLLNDQSGNLSSVKGAHIERIREPFSCFEFIFLGLRTVTGIERQRYCKRFGYDLITQYGSIIHRQKEAGMLWEDEERVAPTPKGIWYADEIALQFLK